MLTVSIGDPLYGSTRKREWLTPLEACESLLAKDELKLSQLHLEDDTGKIAASDQAILIGWLGQNSSGSTRLSDFQNHVHEYGSKVLKFYNLDKDAATQVLTRLKHRSSILEVLKCLSNRSQFLESYDLTEEHIHFAFSKKRLDWEVAFLNRQGIKKIVSLTESHHNKDTLQEHFEAVP